MIEEDENMTGHTQRAVVAGVLVRCLRAVIDPYPARGKNTIERRGSIAFLSPARSEFLDALRVALAIKLAVMARVLGSGVGRRRYVQ